MGGQVSWRALETSLMLKPAIFHLFDAILAAATRGSGKPENSKRHLRTVKGTLTFLQDRSKLV